MTVLQAQAVQTKERRNTSLNHLTSIFQLSGARGIPLRGSSFRLKAPPNFLGPWNQHVGSLCCRLFLYLDFVLKPTAMDYVWSLGPYLEVQLMGAFFTLAGRGATPRALIVPKTVLDGKVRVCSFASGQIIASSNEVTFESRCCSEYTKMGLYSGVCN